MRRRLYVCRRRLFLCLTARRQAGLHLPKIHVKAFRDMPLADFEVLAAFMDPRIIITS